MVGMTSMTQPLELSILRAPIAAIDRRALSQAWFSALGFEKTRATAIMRSSVTCRPEQRCLAKLPPKSTDARRRRDRGHLTLVPRYARYSRDERNYEVERIERRTPSVLARHIERTLLAKHRHARVVTTLEAAAGRAIILSLKRGAQMHLIAICPRNVQPEIARALAEACHALAGRGIRLNALAKVGS